MGTVEDEIRAQGQDVFRLMEAGPPRVFDRKRWGGMLMNLAMSDPELKVRLFRFAPLASLLHGLFLTSVAAHLHPHNR